MSLRIGILLLIPVVCWGTPERVCRKALISEGGVAEIRQQLAAAEKELNELIAAPLRNFRQPSLRGDAIDLFVPAASIVSLTGATIGAMVDFFRPELTWGMGTGTTAGACIAGACVAGLYVAGEKASLWWEKAQRIKDAAERVRRLKQKLGSPEPRSKKPRSTD